MFRTVDLRMKESKASPPAKRQKLLGVLNCNSNMTVPEFARILAELRSFTKHYSWLLILILTTSMFGNLHRSSLPPKKRISGTEALNTGLRDAITALLYGPDSKAWRDSFQPGIRSHLLVHRCLLSAR